MPQLWPGYALVEGERWVKGQVTQEVQSHAGVGGGGQRL